MIALSNISLLKEVSKVPLKCVIFHDINVTINKDHFHGR